MDHKTGNDYLFISVIIHNLRPIGRLDYWTAVSATGKICQGNFLDFSGVFRRIKSDHREMSALI